ncbi:MAG: collagen-like protein, partial [Thaumarchaeota archaeon S15]
MSGRTRELEVAGSSPFEGSGVFEAVISLAASRPGDEAASSRSFEALWRSEFHLRVRDGRFA